jgi:hypothetical protein
VKITPLRLLFGVALIGSLGLELLGEKTPPVQVWDYPLFFAVTGLLGCLALSFLAKGLIAPLLDRPEDYYETAGTDDPADETGGA